MSAFYFCKNENRHAAVAAHLTLNGIDFLEVLDSAEVGKRLQLAWQELSQQPALPLSVPRTIDRDGERILRIVGQRRRIVRTCSHGKTEHTKGEPYQYDVRDYGSGKKKGWIYLPLSKYIM